MADNEKKNTSWEWDITPQVKGNSFKNWRTFSKMQVRSTTKEEQPRQLLASFNKAKEVPYTYCAVPKSKSPYAKRAIEKKRQKNQTNKFVRNSENILAEYVSHDDLSAQILHFIGQVIYAERKQIFRYFSVNQPNEEHIIYNVDLALQNLVDKGKLEALKNEKRNELIYKKPSMVPSELPEPWPKMVQHIQALWVIVSFGIYNIIDISAMDGDFIFFFTLRNGQAYDIAVFSDSEHDLRSPYDVWHMLKYRDGKKCDFASHIALLKNHEQAEKYNEHPYNNLAECHFSAYCILSSKSKYPQFFPTGYPPEDDTQKSKDGEDEDTGVVFEER